MEWYIKSNLKSEIENKKNEIDSLYSEYKNSQTIVDKLNSDLDENKRRSAIATYEELSNLMQEAKAIRSKYYQASYERDIFSNAIRYKICEYLSIYTKKAEDIDKEINSFNFKSKVQNDYLLYERDTYKDFINYINDIAYKVYGKSEFQEEPDLF